MSTLCRPLFCDFPPSELTTCRRTHRERKELYIKALEDEVLRLKEVYSNASQDKEKLAEENKYLRGLLQQNGIASAMDDMISNHSLGYPSSASGSGGSFAPGSATAYTPPLTSKSTAPSTSSQVTGGQHQGPYQQQQQQQQHHHHHHHHHSRSSSQQHRHPMHPLRVDYEQAGIDFVLTYESPDDPSRAYMSPPPQ